MLSPGASSRNFRDRAGSRPEGRFFAGPAAYVRSRESFAIETTLAGKWTHAAIRAALERSFFTRLFYICLDNPERSIQRVRERVAQGGHDVPDADVRRRYARSLANACQVLRMVHQGLVFDNSGAEPRPVSRCAKGDCSIWPTKFPRGPRRCLSGREAWRGENGGNSVINTTDRCELICPGTAASSIPCHAKAPVDAAFLGNLGTPRARSRLLSHVSQATR